VKFNSVFNTYLIELRQIDDKNVVTVRITLGPSYFFCMSMFITIINENSCYLRQTLTLDRFDDFIFYFMLVCLLDLSKLNEEKIQDERAAQIHTLNQVSRSTGFNQK
jgi:hypothetical protein